VALFGGVTYLFLSWCLGIKELFVLVKMIDKIEGLSWFSQKFWRKKEAITINDSSRVE